VLNPVESLWSNLKGGGAGQPPGDILDDVIAAADHGIQRIRHAHHALVVDGGIERHGLWVAHQRQPPTQWAIYPDITGPEHAASDHAAIFIDINV
jgi:hypothetical protein